MDGSTEMFHQVISCDYCVRNRYPKLLWDRSFNIPHPGYIGSNYENTRVLLVGQNPGTSPERLREQDKEFARAKVAVRQNPNAQTMAALKDIQDIIMPTWDIVRDHFLLAEYGLQLDDIAYTNVVRCRTIENVAPRKKITEACISNHFARWIDWLEPRVVICIGKWAHNQIGNMLKSRGIPSDFINRQRNLPSIDRQKNRDAVVNLVRSAINGDDGVQCNSGRR